MNDWFINACSNITYGAFAGIFTNSNDTMLGVHNYLLQVKSDGRNLEGFKTYYEIFNEELLSEKISWVKEDKNNLEILNR